MNDDELIMALREQRGTIAMTTPVEQIIDRGRAVRARRRIPVVAATMGVATVGAATAVAVGVAPATGHLAASPPAGSHPNTSHPASSPGVQLAAWTVTRQADGTIQVTIREANDPAGLQRVLRADGIPASVTFFTGKANPACRAYPGALGLGSPLSGNPFSGPLAKVVNFYPVSPQVVLVLHPAALPSGAGLQISTSGIVTSGTPRGTRSLMLEVGLVKASPQCTGS
jgi:hypothetical protein